MKKILNEWKKFINENDETSQRAKNIADKVAGASDAALTKMAGDSLVTCRMRSKYLDSPNSGYQKMANEYVRAMMSGDLVDAKNQLKKIAKFVEELHCNPQPGVDPKGVADEFLGLLMGTVAGIKSAERGSCVAPSIEHIVPDNVGTAQRVVILTPLSVIEKVAKGTYKCPKKKK
jgi:hypothetical protein